MGILQSMPALRILTIPFEFGQENLVYVVRNRIWIVSAENLLEWALGVPVQLQCEFHGIASNLRIHAV